MSDTITMPKNGTRFKLAAVVFGILATASGWVYAVAIKSADVDQLKKDVAEMQAERKADHDLIIEMKTDITWIRNALESKP